MKILLTTRQEPAEPRNPIGILDLSAYLRSFGHEVDCYYIEKIKDLDISGGYDVVGLSVLQSVDGCDPLEDALYLKNKFKTKTVVGGKWTRTINDKQKDIFEKNQIEICCGAGENYFIDREIDFENYPAWDRVDFDTLGDVQMEIMSTRGCPYRCHFCHNTEKKVSYFTASRTAENIQLLINSGVTGVFFVDDIFTLKSAHMAGIYNELIKRGIQIEGRNMFFAHVNHINEKNIYWIKKYKPKGVQIGVESGDDKILELMGKTFSSQTAFEKIKLLYDNGVKVEALFLIGFPGESRETLKNTLRFIKSIKQYVELVWVSHYQPVLQTEGYNLAVERGGIVEKSKRNTDITYIDPNLTQKELFLYHYLMKENIGELQPLVRVVKEYIVRLLPYIFTRWVFELRQNEV